MTNAKPSRRLEQLGCGGGDKDDFVGPEQPVPTVGDTECGEIDGPDGRIYRRKIGFRADVASQNQERGQEP